MAEHVLISTLVAAIVLAFLFGFAAQRAGLSPLVGYLIAGLAVGPHTPGFVADSSLALQLSEIGVILLMFGVGLKVSLKDLWSARGAAIPCALLHTPIAAAVGFYTGQAMGLAADESLILGVSISVASTIVLLRALEERRLTKTEAGRICIGWLLIEDVLIILAIVILPSLAAALSGEGASVSPVDVGLALAFTIGKITVFVAAILAIGARFFPWLIIQIAHTKSRELLSLGTLALALGVAYAAFRWFDASFALGAFLAGLALNGTKFSHKVAEDSLPLRDTFAVLFFVAVGMLFDPTILFRDPFGVAAVVAAITIGKAAPAYVLMRLFGKGHRAGVLAALGLAQIGEFSFVLAGLGLGLGVVSQETYNLVLAGALISIALNPFLMRLVSGPAPAPQVQGTPGAL